MIKNSRRGENCYVKELVTGTIYVETPRGPSLWYLGEKFISKDEVVNGF